MKFNIGDKVRVIESPLTDERLTPGLAASCEWIRRELDVIERTRSGALKLNDGENYDWHDAWLELVDDHAEREGDAVESAMLKMEDR